MLGEPAMTKDERQKRIEYLCGQIEVEKDPTLVAEFAHELSDLLESDKGKSPDSPPPSEPRL